MIPTAAEMLPFAFMMKTSQAICHSEFGLHVTRLLPLLITNFSDISMLAGAEGEDNLAATPEGSTERAQRGSREGERSPQGQGVQGRARKGRRRGRAHGDVGEARRGCHQGASSNGG